MLNRIKSWDRLGLRQQLAHRLAVGRRADPPAETLQIGRQAGADLGVVVDDQAMSIHAAMPTLKVATYPALTEPVTVASCVV